MTETPTNNVLTPTKQKTMSCITSSMPRRLGVVLLLTTMCGLIAVGAYWNFLKTPFVYAKTKVEYIAVQVPSDDDQFKWFRFDHLKETYQLDRKCLEEKRQSHKTVQRKDLFRSEGIFNRPVAKVALNLC